MKKNINITVAQLTLLLLFSISVSAQSAEREECSNQTAANHYQQQYNVGEFYIFYDLHGENAISDLTDTNKNSVPDIVEDTMLQLVSMRDVLSSLGFTHPFDQHRYQRAGVDRIYIGIRDQNNNGMAFDPPHRDISSIEQPCVLLIRLSNDLKTGNLTPAHELFHLYQYGYTVFKNRWYLEGLARWSEGLIGKRDYSAGSIPSTQDEEAALFSQSYNAVPFWMAFLDAVSASTLEERSYSDDILDRRYINGDQIIHNEATTHGATAVIKLLESFDSLDGQIGTSRELRPKSWPNSDRSAEANNPLLLNAVYRLIENERNE
ncbi:unnamed protein product [Ectocarpus sp. 12 AP-2014]